MNLSVETFPCLLVLLQVEDLGDTEIRQVVLAEDRSQVLKQPINPLLSLGIGNGGGE